LFTFSLEFYTDVFTLEGKPDEPPMDIEIVASLAEIGIPVPAFKRELWKQLNSMDHGALG